ncbi:ComF family protein [Litoribacillus peritrichatus]|uniref:ComF family protein n=1 Tax=Litoribacillus peritrichatus TaxID=718191 RepID=UPI0031D93296
MNKCQLCLSRTNSSDQYFCYQCLPYLPFITKHCKKCALPTEVDLDVCGRCQTNPFDFDRAFSLFEYRYPMVHWIGSYKANKLTNLVQLEQWFYSAFYHQYHEQTIDAIIAIPSSPVKTLIRGEIPSYPLAQAIHKRTHIPFIRGVLSKDWSEQSQKSKSREARLSNHRFKLHEERLWRGSTQLDTVLLVDDVMTTGASLNEASKLLKKAGVGKVFTLTIARTPSYP